MSFFEITRYEEENWSDFKVWRDGQIIGRASIDHGKNYIDDVFLYEQYRGKGYRKILYDHIEKVLGIKLVPSSRLGPEGVKFWERRKNEQGAYG